MKDYVLYLVAFAAGAAAGYFAKDLIEKKKSENIEEPEEESEDQIDDEGEEESEDPREKYKEMASVYSGPQEGLSEEGSYHCISDEEYYKAKHRDSLIFYSQDGKLARDSDNKLVGEETIGAEALDRYHNGYADDLYIFNENTGIAYWVTYSDHSYTEDVLNSD